LRLQACTSISSTDIKLSLKIKTFKTLKRNDKLGISVIKLPNNPPNTRRALHRETDKIYNLGKRKYNGLEI
jgi:hypothetical protein